MRRVGWTQATCAGLVAVEAAGTALLFAPLPVAWMWVGSLVYELTGSLTADLAVALLGFLASAIFVMQLLTRIDVKWIELRRRGGHRQRDGALTRVVVAWATVGLLAFWVWFHFSGAFIIPFMPRY